MIGRLLTCVLLCFMLAGCDGGRGEGERKTGDNECRTEHGLHITRQTAPSFAAPRIEVRYVIW